MLSFLWVCALIVGAVGGAEAEVGVGVSQPPAASSTPMTLNGVRIPCYCHRCLGASKCYRTVARHTKWDAADGPLFPSTPDTPSEEKLDPTIDNQLEQPVQNMDDDLVRPYPESISVEDDIVSHVESLPNCNEPIYQTV